MVRIRIIRRRTIYLVTAATLAIFGLLVAWALVNRQGVGAYFLSRQAVGGSTAQMTVHKLPIARTSYIERETLPRSESTTVLLHR